MEEFLICLVLIVVVFLIANIWLLWYWALLLAVCVVLGGFFVVTDGMLD
jgi:hypothetical protein